MPQKNNKGLGRGLDALFTEFDETATADETVVELNLDDIRSNPYQPRRKFDETSLSELSDSIRKQGVFQPVIVRQSKVSGYEIIAGERRCRASRMAGRKTIPAIVRNLNEEEMMEIAVLENLQREDLTPLEEAQAYNTLMENLNLTQAQVSEKLGKSRPYIANYLRLLSLPKAVKDYLDKGSLSMGQARTLLSVKDKNKLVALADKTVREGLTVRQLEGMVNELNGSKDRSRKVRKQEKVSPYIRHSEERLKEKFGTKVAIKSNSRTGKGRIEIDYLSNDDLNRILEILDITLD